MSIDAKLLTKSAILSNLGMEGNFLSLIKIIYKNPVTNITLNGKRLDILPLRLGRR